MTRGGERLKGVPIGEIAVFDADTRARFAAAYPEKPIKLRHKIEHHPLLEVDAIAALAEALPPGCVEYNRGDVPIGVTGKPAGTGIPIGETIRNIARSNSWAVLKNIEQHGPYATLLHGLIAQLRDEIRRHTGTIHHPQGYLFISSPNAITPYHFDPEHNILLQLAGTKQINVFAPGDARFAPDERHESYHTGGGRELVWDESFADHSAQIALDAGEAVYVPVMAPHFVRNGPRPSISLSITWRSEWSYAEADARAFNKLLRGLGMRPRAPERWPSRNSAKALGWRIARRFLPKS